MHTRLHFILYGLGIFLIAQSTRTVEAAVGYDITVGGAICIDASDRDVRRAVALLRASGVASRTDGDCLYVEGVRVRVPHGLEGWSVTKLRRAGFSSVHHPWRSAGGSGIIKRRVAPSFIFPQPITNRNYRSAVRSIECGIARQLRQSFDEVQIRNKCDSDVSGPEMCWNIWLAGHTANSRGLNSSSLEGLVSDKYWFSTRIELWIADYDDYPETGGSVARIDLVTVSSKFARYPPDRSPEAHRYQFISEFAPSVDEFELDEIIGHRVSDIITARSLRCDG